MSTSTNYLRKLISSSFHEGSFSKVLRGKYLHGTHDLIKKSNRMDVLFHIVSTILLY